MTEPATPILLTPILLTHWGAFQADVADGRLRSLSPLPGDPDPSPIG